MTAKNVSLWLLWLLPILIIVILLSSSFLMWKDSQDLSYDLLRSESNNAVAQIKTRLEIFLFERSKDLSHLASLKNYQESLFLERFRTDALGIISREQTYYAISYIDSSGKILVRTGLDTIADSSAPLYKLDLNVYLKRLSSDTEMILISLPPTISRGEELLALFKPIFVANKKNPKLAGAVIATLRERYLIQNIITTQIQKSNFVTIHLGDTLVYQNKLEQKKPSKEFTQKTKSTVSIRSSGWNWSISVFPPKNGLFDELIRQNNLRFVVIGIASVIASWLLALALYISHRLRLTTTELTRSEERYRHLAENASDMIFQQSILQGTYDYVSPAAERLTGYKPSEFYESPFLLQKILHSDDLVQFNKQWHQILKGNTPLDSEYRIIHKSGEQRWLNQRNSLVYDKIGSLVAIEGILTDITEQKKATFEREKLIRELESKNRDLERFTYIISHELKTPLITIKGFLGYLEDEATKGDFSGFHQDVLRIISATETMGRLLNDLIILNRIGHATSAKQNIDLYELAQKCVELFSQRIRKKSIQVIISDNLPEVIGYRNELLELYKNLIDNAIKFTAEQPSPVIEIGANTSKDNTILFVKDNGKGFETKYSEKIFGLFDKLDSTTQGTGAGLALVKRIVDHHGGWIRAESPGLGKGTTVYFMLPYIVTKG